LGFNHNNIPTHQQNYLVYQGVFSHFMSIQKTNRVTIAVCDDE
jgi:hypothetical protein